MNEKNKEKILYLNNKQFINLILILFLNIAIFTLFFVLFSQVLKDMYQIWRWDGDNAHGLLVPFISGFLIWKKREELKRIEIKPSFIGLVVIVVSLILFGLFFKGGILVMTRLTLVSTFLGIVIFNYGIKIFYAFLFPLLFLTFMIPIPLSIIGLISFPLQLLMSKISAFIIGMFSIPVYREGNMLYFSETILEVAQICSGIRSLIAFVLLGVLFSYIIKCSNFKKLLLISSAIPLAFFVNIIRVSGTGILAHFFGNKIATGFLHDFSGIVVFIIGIILYMVLGKLIVDH
jgi:exosortase